MALEKKKPTLLQALTPLIALALLLSIGYGVYGLRAEILLLVATSVAGLIAIMLGYSYREIERGIIENMMKGIPLSQAAGAPPMKHSCGKVFHLRATCFIRNSP